MLLNTAKVMGPTNREIASHHTDVYPAVAEYFLGENDHLGDQVIRRDYFEHLDEDDFITMVQETASLVRGNSSRNPQSFDGHNAKLRDLEIPDSREKEALLRQVWDAARSILRNQEYTDEDALELAGLVVGGGILSVHPFADGNGRTSRVLSYIIERGTNNIENLEPILIGHNSSGGWSIMPDRSVTPRPTQDIGENVPDIIQWSHSADIAKLLNIPDAYGGLVSYSTYRNRAIQRLLTELPDNTTSRSAISSTINGELSGEDFLRRLARSERSLYYGAKIQQIIRSERATFISDYVTALQTDKDIELPEESPLRNPSIDQAERIGGILLAKIACGRVTMAEYQVALHRANSTIDEPSSTEQQKLLDHKTLNAMVEKIEKGEQLTDQEIFFLYEVDRPIAYLGLRNFNPLYRDYEEDPRVAYLKQDASAHQEILAKEYGRDTAEMLLMDSDVVELNLQRFIAQKIDLNLLVRKLGALNSAYNLEVLQKAGADLNVTAILQQLEENNSYSHIAKNFSKFCEYGSNFKNISSVMAAMDDETLVNNAAGLVANGVAIRDIISRLTPVSIALNRQLLIQSGATPADLQKPEE